MEFLRNLFRAKASNDHEDADVCNETIDCDDYLTSQSSGTIDEIITYDSYNNDDLLVETPPEFVNYASVRYEKFDADEPQDILDLEPVETKTDLAIDTNFAGNNKFLVEIDVTNSIKYKFDEPPYNEIAINTDKLDTKDELSIKNVTADKKGVNPFEINDLLDFNEIAINTDTLNNIDIESTKNYKEIEKTEDDINEFDKILDNLQKNNGPEVTRYKIIPENADDLDDLDDILLKLQKDGVLKVKFKADDTTSVISISSEDAENFDKDLSDTGYNSSDFEFITEDEAKKSGLYTPFKIPTSVKNNNTMNTVSIEKMEFQDDYSYRDSHIIPEGDAYLNLFQGIYAPQFESAMYFMDNKSVRATKSMHVDFEGVGFDMRVLNRNNIDDVPEQYKAEAEENAQKIISMYPAENRKRRRRF